MCNEERYIINLHMIVKCIINENVFYCLCIIWHGCCFWVYVPLTISLTHTHTHIYAITAARTKRVVKKKSYISFIVFSSINTFICKKKGPTQIHNAPWKLPWCLQNYFLTHTTFTGGEREWWWGNSSHPFKTTVVVPSLAHTWYMDGGHLIKSSCWPVCTLEVCHKDKSWAWLPDRWKWIQ